MTLPLIVAGVAVVTALVVLYGELRWKASTRALRDRLEAARLPTGRRVFDRSELEGLPAPVQRYFRAVMQQGQPIVVAVAVKHAGTFNTGNTNEQWRAFTSTQRVITRRAGFDWDARVAMMPGATVLVHDAYVAGEGLLHVALFGLLPLVHLRGTGELAMGQMLRYFAEGAWYPTALLPSQGVLWEAVDEHSAHATLKDGDVSSRLLFGFDAEGLIATVNAEARGRMVGGAVVPTPWHGRFWNYVVRDGMRVPLDGEVAWLLPEGAKPYWRGHITEIHYEFAQD